MTRTASGELFALVESFFIEYLPRQAGMRSEDQWRIQSETTPWR
jgi:hypothetical protein